jgi:hypothetical protein
MTCATWTKTAMRANRNRYPALKKDANGKPVCRGCGSPVGYRRRCWCSADCYKRFGDIQGIKSAVFKRDGGRCQMCSTTGGMLEYDHILPHSEGGQFTVENLRLLCPDCHTKRTAHWHKARALARKGKMTGSGQLLLITEHRA